MVDFTFKPRITKKMIYSRFHEEQLMEFYLHVPVVRKLFRNPLRRDRYPTCSFYRNRSGELAFKDFATGQSLTVIGVVMETFHVGYQQALRIIANDMGMIDDPGIKRNKGVINENPVTISEREFTDIRVEVRDFTPAELRWWESFGITKETLEKFKVYACKHVFLNGELFAESSPWCPIYGYYGGKAKKGEYWRIYFPRKKSFRFLNNWPGKKIQGMGMLPESGKLLVITKSLKDVMTLHSCGITAVAPCSENLFLPEETLSSLKERFPRIVVLYDSDRPGKAGMARIRRLHPELTYTFIPEGGKDISDFYRDNGRKETLRLIRKFILWLRKTPL